ncbi:MAG: TolC family protein, partial [Planctomycetota bacterium]|nr:TolC family protein [Planctomycetota bacterium]
MWRSLRLLALLAAMLAGGCQSSPMRSSLSLLPSATPDPSACPLVKGQPSKQAIAESSEESPNGDTKAAEPSLKLAGWQPTSKADSVITQAAHSQSGTALELPAPLPETDQKAEISGTSKLNLAEVISSVLTTYPMVQAAALQFDSAQGQIISAEGAFDTKLKGATENGPLGFYETYRHSVGAIQPLANGGEVFGGYRVGRGDFQPWYQERQTNDGGEFKAGLSVPLSRNVSIDDRRAGVRKAGLDLAAADPQFRGEVIFTVRAASEAFWQWVAAAAQQRIARQVLDLATTRNDGLEEEVRMGAKALPDLKDNRRSILSREAKLIETERKVTQSATKLSIFLRTPGGEPRLASIDEVPDFPNPVPPDEAWQIDLTQQAIQSRPELRELELAIERIDVEIAEADNDLLPNISAVLVGSQDVGEPTSKKRDKSEFELEAALLVDVPLQRRKAKGKLTSLEAKRAQLAQKRRLSEDKIRTDIAIAFEAVRAAYERVQRTAEARDLADYMAEVEREKFNAGESDLLKVALREEKAAESAGKAIEAQLEYQLGLAHLRAATGIDD